MNLFSKSAVLLSAGMLALAGVAQAQLQTYQTQTIYNGGVVPFNTSATMGQTFSNVSAVKSMTYNFFSGSGGVTGSTSLGAVFGEWNSSTNSFITGTTVDFGTIVIPATGWTSIAGNGGPGSPFPTYEYSFDLSTIQSAFTHSTFGYLTNSTKTYAMMLTNQGATTGLGLGLTSSGSLFTYGVAFDGEDYYRDWTFAQIVVAPGNQTLVPIPESSTVATLGSAMLVAFLVNSRMRQRRSNPQASATLVAA